MRTPSFRFIRMATFPSTLKACLASLSLTLSLTHACGQAGGLDPSFNPVDVGYGNGDGPNSSISCSSLQSDGKILIGGVFTSYNGSALLGLARLNLNGTVDQSFMPGNNGAVAIMKRQPDGRIIISGPFTQIHGATRNRLARLNADGTLDTTFDPGSGPVGLIRSIAIQMDGKLLVAGTFTSYDGVPCNKVARLNTDGSIDPSFNIGSGPNDEVRAIDLLTNGKIIIAGSFSHVNGIPQRFISRLNPDGSVDTSFLQWYFGLSDPIANLIVQPDNRIVIAGPFTSFEGFRRKHIARLLENGDLDTSFDPGDGPNSDDAVGFLFDGLVTSIVLQSNGKILIGGKFNSLDGQPSNHLARLNSDGSKDTSFDPEIGTATDAAALLIMQNGQILTSSSHTSIPLSFVRHRFHRLNENGSRDNTFGPGTGADELVRSIALQPDGKILIGGDFTKFNGVPMNYLARLNYDGSLDTSFVIGSGTDRPVESIALQPDGKILIGGGFNVYNGTPRSSIARLNSNGSLDLSFDPGNGTNGRVLAIAVQANGDILVGGTWYFFAGAQNPNLARLTSNGTRLNSAYPFGGPVNSISVQADGKILISGSFSNINGVARPGIARLNADQSLDYTFPTGTGPDNGAVGGSFVLPDGRILVYGSFSQFNGLPRTKLARLESDGSVDTSFVPDSGIADQSIRHLAIQPDGRILIAGHPFSNNETYPSRVFRLLPDGSLDPDFGSGTGADGLISKVALQSDGRMLAVGDFTSYNGVGRNRIARLLNCASGCSCDDGNVCTVNDVVQMNGLCTGTYLDTDADWTCDSEDGCPNDPLKIAAGACGCGIPDTDTDADGTVDCNDGCPIDPLKIAAGICGCGTPDTDTDGDGTADCNDACPNDPLKISAGACGCGSPETDTDGDGTADCIDGCPNDPLKTVAGICGCGSTDADTDNDGIADCIDSCPTAPGQVGSACDDGDPDTNLSQLNASCTCEAVPEIGDYRSVASGAWAAPQSWEVYTGSAFVPASLPPDQSSGWIAIRNGHSITIASPVTVDQVVVWSGGALAIQSTLNLNDGPGADLRVKGTLTSASTLNGPGSVTIRQGGVYSFTFSTFSISSVVNIEAGGTMNKNGTTSQALSLSGVINNAGTFNMNGGWISGSQSGVTTINNLTGGVININGWFSTTIGWLTVNFFNAGTFNRNPAVLPIFPMSGRIRNLDGGVVNVNAGTLQWGPFGLTPDLTYQRGRFNVAPGATLNVSSNFGFQFLGTEINNNGALGTAETFFVGNGPQALNGNGVTPSLTINNPNGVILGGTQTITSSLTLSNGTITLGNNDLIVDGASLTGGSESSHVITNGTGSLRRTVPAGGSSYFPVGTSTSFAPATINLDGSGTTDAYRVRVNNGVSTTYDTNDAPTGTAITSAALQHTWTVRDMVSGGTNASITLQWNAQDEAQGFTRNACRIARNDGSAWDPSADAPAGGTGPFTLQRSGIPDLGPFTVLGGIADLCPNGPEPGTPCDDGNACTSNDVIGGDCQCSGISTDTDGDGVCDANDGCPNDPLKTAVGACGCGIPDTDTDSDGIADCIDTCPSAPGQVGSPCDDGNPCTLNDQLNNFCICSGIFTDSDGDGTCDANDACPGAPGQVGWPCDDGDPCTTGDVVGANCNCAGTLVDSDGDGIGDCNDGCPSDPLKIAPGSCGCNNPDTDSDTDGTADCIDECPNDPNKTMPGICGCGTQDTDTDSDGAPDCFDGCPNDPLKIAAGSCGCGTPDTDNDGDGTADCNDGCPNDPAKTAPGSCGCGVDDLDSDNDGAADCNDGCPNDPFKIASGICGCGTPDTDNDNDGTADCNDGCPNDPLKTAPGTCGCGEVDDPTDTDNDGTADCIDQCPNDPLKIAEGPCGCNSPDTDSDNDGIADCNDGCPSDPLKTAPGTCGCGVVDNSTDTDNDGIVDCIDTCPSAPGQVGSPCDDGDPCTINDAIGTNCQCAGTGADTDGDGTCNASDCAPNDPAVHPGAPEICDGIDNNCDGHIDLLLGDPQTMCGTANEGGSITLTAPTGLVFSSVVFASYGNPSGSCGAFTIGGCHAPSSLSVLEGLVIGQNSVTIPASNDLFGDPCAGVGKRLYVEVQYMNLVPAGVPEICNGIDDDCDGLVDEGFPTYYLDNDGDGYGDPGAPTSCGAAGSVPNALDCDDTAPTVYTGAPDVCDGLDNDCNGSVDEFIMSGLSLYLPFTGNADDQSGNGHNGTLFNTTPASGHTGAANAAFAFNGSSGRIEVADHPDLRPASFTLSTWIYFDAVPGGVQCIVNKPLCGGYSDSYGIWFMGGMLQVGWGYDPNNLDYRGYTAPAAGAWHHVALSLDDNANSASVYVDNVLMGTYPVTQSIAYDNTPLVIGAEYEYCALGFYFNGRVDETALFDRALNATEIAQLFSGGPIGYPQEVCDGIDNDCNGQIDDGVGAFYYTDADGDGYGDPASAIQACAQPPNTVALGGDCAPADASYHPGAPEICDGIDNNCDGHIDLVLGDPQTMCGTANEGGSITLTAPTGLVFSSVVFASYGNPSGSCGAFTIGGCHAPSSLSVLEGLVIGQNSVTIPASNALFGDPCAGVGKRLYVEVQYMNLVPAGAPEICNGIDDDCDGLVDEGFPTYYIDNDGDGYGDPGAPTSCGAASSVANALDCDDADAGINPMAYDVCPDGIDNDCDGAVDDALRTIRLRSGNGSIGGPDNVMHMLVGPDDGPFPSPFTPADFLAARNGDAPIIIAPDPVWITTLPADTLAQWVNNAGQPIGGHTGLYATDFTVDGDVVSAELSLHYAVDNMLGGGPNQGVYLNGQPLSGNTSGGDQVGQHTITRNDIGPLLLDGLNTLYVNATDQNSPGALMFSATITVSLSCATPIWFADADLDGFGDPSSSITSGTQPTGYVADSTDCDDADAAINPMAYDACSDGIDNNCDGQVDEGCACSPADIALMLANTQPAQSCMLSCYGGQPNDLVPCITDCHVQAGFSSACATCVVQFQLCTATSCPECQTDPNSAACIQCRQAAGCDAAFMACSGLQDADGDGDFAPFDCNDNNAAVNSNGVEGCLVDGLDNDCDGQVDEDALVDADNDGYTLCDGDCNDTDDTVNPAGTEICDGIDNDCDGLVDDGFPVHYLDNDGDGFGDPNVLGACGAVGSVPNNLDCDDTDPTIYTGAPELCDGLDNDCNGTVDDNLSNDTDGDGFTPCTGDCDDANATVYPGAPELCDGLDNDCSGAIEPQLYADNDQDGYGEAGNPVPCGTPGSTNQLDCDDTDPLVTLAPLWYPDVDGDGYGVYGVAISACAQPAGHAGNSFDCDDSDPQVFPGQGCVECSPADLALMASDPGVINPAQPCLVSCGSAQDPQQCFSDCLADNGLTGACADCFAAYGYCLTASCPICQEQPESPACIACQENSGCKEAFMACSGLEDVDDDGYFAPFDCNDLNAAAHPDAPELCDGLDNDCDGAVDEGCDVRIAVKVMLEGPYNAGAGTMGDGMRDLGLVPTTEPYTGLGYTHVGGGGESTSPAVLAGTGDDAVVDWVLLELRDAIDPAVIVASRSALLQRDGDVVDVDGTGPVTMPIGAGTYHVAVRHRNHLGCMTSAALGLSPALVEVDFSLGVTSTFGTNARKSITGAFPVQALWAGDVTGNGQIKYTGSGNDRDPILQRIGGAVPTNTVSGYQPEDVNLDGAVKYTGSQNDRDRILQNIGGAVPTNTRAAQLP